jgi:hypothetical protein
MIAEPTFTYIAYQPREIRRLTATLLILSCLALLTATGSTSGFGQTPSPTPEKSPTNKSKSDTSKSNPGSSDSDTDADNQKKQDDQKKPKRGTFIFAAPVMSLSSGKMMKNLRRQSSPRQALLRITARGELF